MSRVLTFGEGMLRLSVQPGDRLEMAHQFDVFPAGSEANFAASLSRLGVDVAWYSTLPESVLAQRFAGELLRLGIDLDLVSWVPDGRFGLLFVELSSAPRPVRVIYDRVASTASYMSLDTFPWEAARLADLIHVSGITPALSESCQELTFGVADRVASSSAKFTFDVNYRSMLWSPSDARSSFEKLAGKVDLLIVNREDARDVFDLRGDPQETLSGLNELFQVEDVVLSLGSEGSAWRTNEATGFVPARQATIIDRPGAGDAFAAGVVAGYLEGNLETGVQMGTVMAALALGMRGDILITTRDEVLRMMSEQARNVYR